MTEYSLFELAEFWLRAEEPEGNFSDDVKAAFQLIWDVAFVAGYHEANEYSRLFEEVEEDGWDCKKD